MRTYVCLFGLLASLPFVNPARADVAPVPQNAVSWWPAEDNGLDVAGGVNALPLGAPGFTGGVVGRAFAFDGVDDRYLTFEDDKMDITGDLTIEGWINISGASSGSRTIVQKPSGDGQNVCYSLSVNGAGKLTFSSTLASAKTEVNTVAVLPVDTNVHVAITLLAGDLRMFIDGAETAHIFFGTDRPATDAGAVLGATITGAVASGYFAGKIDELSLYSRALGATEIAGIHAAGALGKQRYDAGRQFEPRTADDLTQKGTWRYGEVLPETETGGRPPVTTFTQLTNVVFGSALTSWTGTSPLRHTGNLSGAPIISPENGTDITYLPGAVTLRPGESGRYAALKWTAPATGNYAFSALFAVADSKPTNVYCRVLYENAQGVFTLVPKSQLQNSGTVTQWAKLGVEAGEKIYFLVGDGLNTDPGFDSTSVFASFVPLSVQSATAPTVTTTAATSITGGSATLNGTVNPNGAAASYFFEYGTTTSYGQSTPTQNLASGTAAVPVSATLSGLPASTLYNFRLVATNATGTTNGGNLTFTSGTGGSGTPFTVSLTGQANGVLVRPNTGVEIDAVITPANAGGATIASVQFFVNGQAGAPDTAAPYELDTIVAAPGPRAIYAVATDTLGRTATSETVTFTVAEAAAGNLALVTIVEPGAGSVDPGGFVTYRLVASNTSDRAKITNVILKCPVPDSANFATAEFVDANNQPIKINRPGGGKNPEPSSTKRDVAFYFGDFAPLATKTARLKVRVPFDAHAVDQPVVNSSFKLTGTQGSKSIKGSFAIKSTTITDVVPTTTPRLALTKGVIDLEIDPKDNSDFADSAEGPIALTNPGELVTFLVVATNYGTGPASSITIRDLIPKKLAYVESSMKVNGRRNPSVKVTGSKIEGKFGDLAPGESLVLQYQVRVPAKKEGGPAINELVEIKPAELASANLRDGVDSAPGRLGIKVLPATAAVLGKTLAFPASSAIGEVQEYDILFSNPSKRPARGVQIRQTIPAGTEFVSAPGGTFDAASGVVTFNVGDLAPGEEGTALLTVRVLESVLDLPVAQVVLPAAEIVDPSSAALLAVTRTEAVAAAGLPTFSFESNFIDDPAIPKLGLLATVPMSVRQGDTYKLIFTLTNSSNSEPDSAFLNFLIPTGAEFVSATQGALQGTTFLAFFDNVPPHSAQAVTVTLRATGAVGTLITSDPANDPLRVNVFPITYPGREQSVTIPNVVLEPPRTLIINGDAAAPDNQFAIARAHLDYGMDSCQILINPEVLARVAKIGSTSTNFFVTPGTAHYQFNSGGVLIPLGGNKLVAAGGGNLIGNDGSTLIGNDGSTLVAAGGGNLIQLTGLIGNDGSTLATQSAGAFLAQIVDGAPNNLVAAGGGNMVAAGGGNLIGIDGSTLIGNDGSTFGTIAELAGTLNNGALVAAGGGNLVGNDGASLINGQVSLVAAGGGNMVAAGGGNLVGNDGASLLSSDGSRAVTLGLNGGMMVAAGGGN